MTLSGLCTISSILKPGLLTQKLIRLSNRSTWWFFNFHAVGNKVMWSRKRKAWPWTNMQRAQRRSNQRMHQQAKNVHHTTCAQGLDVSHSFTADAKMEGDLWLQSVFSVDRVSFVFTVVFDAFAIFALQACDFKGVCCWCKACGF